MSREECGGSPCSVPLQQAPQVVLGRERVKGGWSAPGPYRQLSGAVGASARPPLHRVPKHHISSVFQSLQRSPSGSTNGIAIELSI